LWARRILSTVPATTTVVPSFSAVIGAPQRLAVQLALSHNLQASVEVGHTWIGVAVNVVLWQLWAWGGEGRRSRGKLAWVWHHSQTVTATVEPAIQHGNDDNFMMGYWMAKSGYLPLQLPSLHFSSNQHFECMLCTRHQALALLDEAAPALDVSRGVCPLHVSRGLHGRALFLPAVIPFDKRGGQPSLPHVIINCQQHFVMAIPSVELIRERPVLHVDMPQIDILIFGHRSFRISVLQFSWSRAIRF